MHPRERRTTRRQFLFGRRAPSAALSGADALLRACGGARFGRALAGRSGPGGIPLARRDHPVTLPIYADNEPIASGMDPEPGPLNVFNWSDYINPAIVKTFEKQYNVKVKVTTFENEEEALAKLTSGQGELRRLVRDRRLPLARGRGQADPAGQPLVPAEPDERLAGAAEPVLRRALAVHGAVHRSTRPGIAWRTDKVKKARPTTPTRTTCSGTRTSTPARSRSSTTSARRSRWRSSVAASTTSTPRIPKLVNRAQTDLCAAHEDGRTSR